MAEPLTKTEDRRRRQAAGRDRRHQADCPDKFRAIAEWWRIEAEDSASPEQCLTYAVNQEAIAADMEVRPRHHSRKPLDVTRYQWSRRA